jgi:hypothetical protein
MALYPARGEWKQRLLASNSTATFAAGSLVAFNPRRLVVEYTSLSSAAIGIAAHASVDSLANPGKVLVHVPAGAECTFWAPTGTLAQSAVSLGQAVGIKKSGNTMDQVDATITSTVSVIGTIYGPLVDTSTVSKIEVAWQVGQGVWFSGSSNTFAT